MINFGDCLVRSRGAVAIADAVRGGLPKLKVLLGVEVSPALAGEEWGGSRGSGPQRHVGLGSSTPSLVLWSSPFPSLSRSVSIFKMGGGQDVGHRSEFR